MGATNREQLFRQSLQAYDRGDLGEAAEGFQQLVRDGSRDPRHISYCGLLVATVEGRIHDGRVLCELAIREAPANFELHVNLARFYACIGNPAKSFQILESALQLDPGSSLLRRELSRLDRRGRRAVPFLGRKHPLNRYLALMGRPGS
jgi:predicted Zn-dependent protease